MERGFHAFFRHYHNVRALIRRVDPSLSILTPLDDYPLLGPGGAKESFSGLPKTTPLNILELVRRSPTIRFWDLRHADLKVARSLLAFDPIDTYARLDTTTAKDFLDGLRFPPKARQMLFDVFAHSFFNPDDDYSAAELCAMFHYYFTRNPEGLVFDVMNEPFSVGLFRPLQQLLERRGVEVLLGATAERVEREGDAYLTRFTGGEGSSERRARSVVLALTVPALKGLVGASPALASLAPALASLDVTWPFVVWRLYLDRPCRADRAPFAGTTGLGMLDNVSLYERFEGESRRWAAKTGGSVVELHAYAVPPDCTEEAVRRDLLAALHEVYPETVGAGVIDERLLWRADCPAFRPGSHAGRPGIATALPDVLLAGDFVKLPFPSALMERAVSSGFLAANEILARRGLPPEPVRHGPLKGLLPASLAR